MTPRPDPIAATARQASRRRRLGPDASCAICGLTDPVHLSLRRRRLEEHHVAGRSNDTDLVTVLCLNHHASATEAQREAGLFTDGDPINLLEAVARALLSVATYSEQLAVALRRWAELLWRLVAELDRDLPAWRTLGSATCPTS